MGLFSTLPFIPEKDKFSPLLGALNTIQCEKMNSSKKVYFSLYADTCCKPFVGGTFISFCGWIKDRKYIDGDMNVIEIVNFRRAQFVCPHASHSSVSLYAWVLNDFEQLLWFAS